MVWKEKMRTKQRIPDRTMISSVVVANGSFAITKRSLEIAGFERGLVWTGLLVLRVPCCCSCCVRVFVVAPLLAGRGAVQTERPKDDNQYVEVVERKKSRQK